MVSPCSPRLASNSLGREPPACLLSVGIKGEELFSGEGVGCSRSHGGCLPHMHPGIPTVGLSMEGRMGQVHPGCNHHTSSLRAAPGKGSKTPHCGDAVIAALRKLKQEDCQELEVSLGYRLSPRKKRKKSQKQTQTKRHLHLQRNKQSLCQGPPVLVGSCQSSEPPNSH